MTTPSWPDRAYMRRTLWFYARPALYGVAVAAALSAISALVS